MEHKFNQKVYYSDTDAYGVVWHGAYLRWFEMGRIELCEQMGHNLLDLQTQNIALPVVNINVKYKSSAKINDEMIIETFIQKFNPLSVTFRQTIKDKYDNKLFAEAIVDVVAIDNNGKLYRRMPQRLIEAFEKATEKKLGTNATK